MRFRAVWIRSAATTIAMPSSSFAVGRVPSAALISSADTGTKLRKAVPVTAPSVRTPWLKASTEAAEGTTPTNSSACHESRSPSRLGAADQPSSAAPTAAASSTGHAASTVSALYSTASSSGKRAAPRVYQTQPRVPAKAMASPNSVALPAPPWPP